MSDTSDDEVYQQDEHHYDNDPDTEDEVLASDDGEDSYNGTDSDDDAGDGQDDDGQDDDDDDDLLKKKNDKYLRFKIEKQKNDMASDIEDEEDDYLPDSQAWGQDKKLYYNTDFVDKDYRSQKGKEEDISKYEEEEALRIQKRMLEAFDKKVPEVDPFRADQEYNSDDDDLHFNVASMSAEEKRKLLQQESGELLFLVEKFEQYIDEIKDTLEPLIEGLTNRYNAPESLGLKFVKTRYAVLLNYTTNLSFYFTMMSSDDKEIARNHPVMKQLFQCQKLIEELDHAYLRNGKRLIKEIPFVMDALKAGKKIQFLTEEQVSEELSFRMKKDVKESKVSTKATMDVDNDDEDDDEDDEDEQWPSDFDDLELDDGEDKTKKDIDNAPIANKDEEEEKRAITYEMEKNKGLIPKRQKEQRNPRVKYRKKFEKAVVRRKGQVREPKKEIKKYGGEHTGINTRVVKSVKFK